MENNLTKDTLSKFKALGIYQIAGGIIGLLLTFWIISTLHIFSILLIVLLLIAIALYVYSIFSGVLLLKKNTSGLTHSLINQSLQLLGVSLAGFTFQYVSGVFLSAGFDLTESFFITFHLGVSSWQLTLFDDTNPIIINFNFVAFLLILFIVRLKKKIKKEQLESEITSIGQ